jgi:hypothetical protein
MKIMKFVIPKAYEAWLEGERPAYDWESVSGVEIGDCVHMW